MKIGIITVVFIFLCAYGFSQAVKNRTWFLKTDMISYLPLNKYKTGNINIELELPLSDNTSFEYQVGYLHSYGQVLLSDYDFYSVKIEKTAGFQAVTEFRFYLNRRRPITPLSFLIWPLALQLNNTQERFSGLYISADLRYLQTWSVAGADIIEPIPDPYTVKQAKPSLMLRIGFQSISPKKIVVDQSLGFGARYIDSWVDRKLDDTAYPLWSVYWPSGVYPIINYSLKLGLAKK